MSLNFFCLALACCTILAFQDSIYQASHSFMTGTAAQFIQTTTTHAQTTDSKPPEDPALPDLTCILFQDTGCQATCYATAQLYHGVGGTGKCDRLNRCVCAVQLKSPLADLWYKSFHKSESYSVAVLKRIEEDQGRVDQVSQIMRVPFKTPLEYKEALKEILSVADYKDLYVNWHNPAALYTLKDSAKVIALKRSFDKVYSSSILPVVDWGYRYRLVQALYRYKNQPLVFDHIMLQIRRLHNKRFVDFVYHSRNNNISDSAAPMTSLDNLRIVDHVSTFIIDKFLEFSQSPKIDYTVVSTWKLPNSVAKEIRHLQPPYRKYWVYNDLGIDVLNSATDDTKVWWHDLNNTVRFRITPRGDIHQVWNFDGARVEINRYVDPPVHQQRWYFCCTRMTYTKDTETGITSVKWTNDEDHESLAQYQLFILVWCERHGFLLAPEYCQLFRE